ncbi:MAG: ABC transporter substrate-binding protein [Candidatus Bathyarchaeia archaeon]
MRRQSALLLAAASLLLLSSSMLLVSSPVRAQEKRVFYSLCHYGLEPPPLSHYNFFVSGYVWAVQNVVHEPLAVYVMGNGSFIPWLATDWNVDYEAGVVEVHLRRGVMFQDYSRFTSRDVLTYWYLTYGSWPKALLRVEAPDDYTVIYYLDKDKIDPWTLISLLTIFVYPYSVYGQYADMIEAELKKPAPNMTRIEEVLDLLEEFRPETPIGTSPWKLKAISAEGVIFEKWGGWWGDADRIPWDELNLINGGPERTELVQSKFLAGELYWVWRTDSFTEEFWQVILAHPEKYYLVPVPHGTWGPFINCEWYPFNIKEVRQAIYYALNHHDFNVISPWARGGTLVPMRDDQKGIMFVDSVYETYNIGEDFLGRLNRYTYDPSKTEEIFTSLGWTKGPDGIWVTDNGTRLEFDLPWCYYWAAEELDWFVNDWFGKIGIKLNPVPYDYMQFWQLMTETNGYPIYFDFWERAGAWGVWTTIDLEFNLYRHATHYPEIVTVPDWVAPGYGTVNITELALVDFARAVLENDFEKQRDIVKILTWHFNENLYHMPVSHNARTFVANREIFQTPFPEEILGLNMPYGDCWSWLVGLNLGIWFKPKVPYTGGYTIVYFISDVAQFIGEDGNVYGPFKSGDAASIPTNDAKRLVEQGLASYSPPAPTELMEAIYRLEAKLSELKETVNALSKNLDITVSSIVGSITSLLYGILAVQVIVLIIVLVVAVKGFKKA